jgi:hypothetical protein
VTQPSRNANKWYRFVARAAAQICTTQKFFEPISG